MFSPRLLAGAALAALTLIPTLALADFELREKAGEALDVLQDGRIVARYMHGHDVSTPARRLETFKPYLHVFDAEGQAPITKGPGGSFPHHRGIFIGWMKIGVGGKVYDRWHMKGGDQIHEKFTAQQADAQGASFTSQVRWTGATEGDTILEEQRTIRFLPASKPGYAIIDFSSQLKAVAGETKLQGDPEHSGLHYRPADTIDKKKTVYIYPVAKANAHKDKDYPWFGESYTLNGKRYSVVYLSHPENPKGALASAYRDYGRFGHFWTATIPPNETLTIRARFLVSEGELPTAAEIQQAWNTYTGRQDAVPASTTKAAEPPAPPKPKATPGAKPKATPVAQ